MEEKLTVYSKRKTINLPREQPSSSTGSPSTSENSKLPSGAALEKPNKKDKKKPELHAYNDSRKLWKNLSNIFTKSSQTACVESASVKLLKDKDKGSTFRRLSTLFKNPKSSSDTITPLTNIGVSPVGYEVAVSQTKIRTRDDKAIAMAVRLPTGTTTDNVAVTIQLEATKKSDESTNGASSDDTMLMRCREETESKTVFTGTIRVPPNTDISKLANMPLYLVDSNEKLILNPGSKMAYRKLLKPSEEILLSDDESQILVSDIKIKLRLDKIEKSVNKDKPKSAKKKRSIENRLKGNESCNENFKKSKVFSERIKAEIRNIVDDSVDDVLETCNTNPMLEPSKDFPYQTLDKIEKAASISNVENKHRICKKSRKFSEIPNILDQAVDLACNRYESNTTAANIKSVLHAPLSSAVAFKQEENFEQTETFNNENTKTMESGTYTENFAIQSEGFCQNFPVIEDPIEWLNVGYKTPLPTRKTIQDSCTQYSNTNFTMDKEIEAQCSLVLTHYGLFDDKYNTSPTTSSSQMLVAPGGRLKHKASQTLGDDESAETIVPKSTTSTATGCSSIVLSDFSAYHNDLKVPSNSPTSCTEIHNNGHKEVKCAVNDLNLSFSSKNVNNIILKYQKPKTHQESNRNSQARQQQTEDLPFTSSSSVVERTTIRGALGFAAFSGREDVLGSPELTFSSEQSRAFVPKNNTDKTLELLEGARLKLETFLRRNPNRISKQRISDSCGLVPMNHNSSGFCSNRFTETRNANVSFDNPFDPYRREEEDINRRCFDDDEYYERQRRDIRCYFEPENHKSSVEPEKAKENFDFYLNGNTEISPGKTNTVFHVYPVFVKNTPTVKSSHKLQNATATTSQTLQKSQTLAFPSTSKSLNQDEVFKKNASVVCDKLEDELNTLQQLYRDMCSNMKSVLELGDDISPGVLNAARSQTNLKSRTIETINEDLTGTINELKVCLSAVYQILNKPTNSSSKDLNEPSTSRPQSTFSSVIDDLLPKTSQDKQDSSKDIMEAVETALLDIPKPFPLVSSNPEAKASQDNDPDLIDFLEEVNQITATLVDPLTAVDCLLCISPQTKQIKSTKVLETIGSKKLDIFESTPVVSNAPPNHLSELTDLLKAIDTITPSILEPPVADVPCRSESLINQTKLVESTNTTENIDTIAWSTLEQFSKNEVCNVTPNEVNQTYFAMENEIERTIQELLQESKDIKETVLLNRGEEDDEPPFFFKYINTLTEPNPLVICKKILEDVVSSSVALFEKNTEKEDESDKPEEDVKYILNILLEEVNKAGNFPDHSKSATNTFKKELDTVNFIFDTTDKDPGGRRINLQIGDATSQPNSSNCLKNSQITYFCSTVAYNSKVPKTSFSFGETPGSCLEVPQPPCKTPVRRRDGLTITGEDNSTRGLETARLFNELLSLQNDMSNNEKLSNIKDKAEEEMSLEEEFCSVQENICQEFATASRIVDNSIPKETADTHLQEKSQTMQENQHRKLMESENNSNTENSNSEEETPEHSPKHEDNSVHQNATQYTTCKIPKSQKHTHLTESINKDIPKDQPSTSAKAYKQIRTTEEEELVENIDLVRQGYESSTEPELFVPVKASGLTQKPSISYSQAKSSLVYSSSSEEEIVTTAVRKPRSKNKKVSIIEIKPKNSLISDSNSMHVPHVQPLINSDQGLTSLNSYIVLKPAPATSNIQDKLMNKHAEEPSNNNNNINVSADAYNTKIVPKEINVSNVSFESTLSAPETEYEGDEETFQLKFAPTKRKFKSTQELNTPEEIDRIDKNVKENDRLERRTRIVLMESKSSLQLDYEDSEDSENYSKSENFIIEPEGSEELNVINADDVGSTSKVSHVIPAKIEPSKSKPTI